MPRFRFYRRLSFEELEGRRLQSATPVDVDTSGPVFVTVQNAQKVNVGGRKLLSSASSSDTARLDLWMKQYVDVSAIPDLTSVPEMLVLAQQRMFQQAQTHESELGEKLFDLVRKHPDAAYWAHGGSSSDFLIQAMQAYGINARRINLWHTMSDGHVAIEYQSLAFGKLVFFDPLYGVAMLNGQGIPASMNDLMGEFAGRGLNFSEWDFQPVHVGSPDGSTIPVAADQQYGAFLARDYREILKHYFHVVSVASEDYTPQQRLLPGESVARGRWTVYDQIPLITDMTEEEELAFLQQFNQQYNVEQNGRYYLTVHRLSEATTMTLNETFDSTSSAFNAYWDQVQDGGATTDRAAWTTWLTHYATLTGTTVTMQNAAELLITAQRTMFLRATIHETDVGGELLELALADPETAYWANCSSSSDFVLAGMRALGIPAQRISMWHTQNDSHEAIEYYNARFAKYTFYDPLYGTKMIDAAGVPAGFDDLQIQIQQHGFDLSAWRYQPQKVALPVGIRSTAADPRYEYYMQRDYTHILRYYFNFTAVRYEDYTPQQGLLAGSTVARGKWILYDASQFSLEFTESECRAIRDALFAQYGVDHQGRYYLTSCEAYVIGDED